MTCAATIATTSIKVLLACRRSWPRNNIPANVPFDQIASNGAYANRGYSGGNYSNRAYSSNGQSRLSVDDQREFDKYYSKWLEDMRKNHRDDIDKDVRHMQDIMGRLQHTRQHPFRSNRIPGCSTTLTR
ncbi:MAG: hypothetical protein DMG76_33110 [Acidobacteria bacterium]|nr:MAG: hypothetical protein DMG76_33110 [Acidobacteriota bacterium]